jgi:hypothetical protein
MKRITTVWVTALALCAICASGAASASAAEPAFYECKKVKEGGKYTKGCETEKGTGSYEVVEGIGTNPTFRGTNGIRIQLSGYGYLECRGRGTESGMLTGPKTLSTVIEAKLCVATGPSDYCNTTGEPKGTIKLSLNGELGYINKTNHEIGIDLKPEAGEDFADLECGPFSIELTGSVVGHVFPVNKFTKELSLAFTQYDGQQEVTHLEGQPEDTLHYKEDLGSEGLAGLEETLHKKGGDLEIKG